MLIDTGASRSALPKRVLVDDLRSVKYDSIQCGDYDGNIIEHFTYCVDLIIDNKLQKNVELLGTNNPTYGLIGRDVLSRYILNCDGPAMNFELNYVAD